MGDGAVKEIWRSSTGIADLEVDPRELAASEIPGIRTVWREQRERLKGTKPLADFSERLSREWAIETGVIENVYDIDRGVTQTLIEQGFKAELLTRGSTNRPRDLVLRLLNDQKQALDGVFDFVKSERPLSTSYIKELHAALLRSQETTEAVDSLGRTVEIPLVRGEWKTQPNSPIRDGVTYRYCPPEQVASEMERLVAMHALHDAGGVPAEVQAAWLHHRFTQIHPFQDGNGRLARAIASSVLIKHELFPLVVTRDDRTVYLDALEAADGGALKPLVDLIAKLQRVQFVRAADMPETVLSDGTTVRSTLDGLIDAAGRRAAERRERHERVFRLAAGLTEDLKERLESISPDVTKALRRVTPSGESRVRVGEESTGHYYRSQIVENARHHLDYFANLADFRSWVALDMRWERRARLVFAIHGVGRQFSGSLICAPFLEFRDRDDDAETRSTLVPVSEDGFIFFYNETNETVLKRFRPWRERALKATLDELSRNL